MKTIKFKSYILKLTCLSVGLCTVLPACKESELLNPIPETSVSAELVFSTPARVLAQVNGMYKAMKSGDFLGGRNLMLNDIRSEEFLNRLQNIFTGYDAWNHTINSGSADALYSWSAGYAAINSANLVIDGLAANTTVVPAVTSVQYVAEAKFVRALTYYALITLYGQPYAKDGGASPGIPLRLKGQMSTTDNDMPRSSVAQVYEQILKDLNDAEAGLPLTYATPVLNTTRAHRNTAIALKTRVYLTMGMNASVITEAQKMVPAAAPYISASGVANTMQPSIVTIFTANYVSAESIFSLPMAALDFVSGQSSVAYNYNTNQEYSLNPAGIYGNAAWPASDARKSLVRTNANGAFLTKYQNTLFLDYIPVLRYSEVLLNYAEAAAKTGNLAKAAELLTAVRKRSDASYVFPAAALSTQAALVNSILLERRIEFLGEGLRSNDLLRNLLTIPAKGTAPSVTPAQTEYIFPIPNAEISANKAL